MSAEKSYDQIQREAVLTPCVRCGDQYYATHPRPDFLCSRCAGYRTGAEPLRDGQRGSR